MHLDRYDKSSIRTRRLDFGMALPPSIVPEYEWFNFSSPVASAYPFLCFCGIWIALERVNHLVVEFIRDLHTTHLCCLFLAESNQKQVNRNTNLQNTLHSCGIFSQKTMKDRLGELHAVKMLQQQSGVCLLKRCGSGNHKHMPNLSMRSSCHLLSSSAR